MTDARDKATVLRQQYTAYVNAGFTEDQAWELTMLEASRLGFSFAESPKTGFNASKIVEAIT